MMLKDLDQGPPRMLVAWLILVVILGLLSWFFILPNAFRFVAHGRGIAGCPMR